MSTASDNPRVQAEDHAHRARRMLLEQDESMFAFFTARPAPGDDPGELAAWENEREKLMRRGERVATMAMAHALTSLALSRAGGRAR